MNSSFSCYSEWDGRLREEAEKIKLEILNDQSNSNSDLESMSIFGSSGASPSQGSLYTNDSSDLNKPDMCDQATQVTENDDDDDEESRITSDSHNENANPHNYLITRSGNIIYKDM